MLLGRLLGQKLVLVFSSNDRARLGDRTIMWNLQQRSCRRNLTSDLVAAAQFVST